MNGRPWIYTGAFIEVMRWVNRGATDKVHGMFEVKNIPVSTSRNPNLEPSNEHCTKFYVNNFIDWDQYNTIYDPDFLSNGTKAADEWDKYRK